MAPGADRKHVSCHLWLGPVRISCHVQRVLASSLALWPNAVALSVQVNLAGQHEALH